MTRQGRKRRNDAVVPNPTVVVVPRDSLRFIVQSLELIELACRDIKSELIQISDRTPRRCGRTGPRSR